MAICSQHVTYTSWTFTSLNSPHPCIVATEVLTTTKSNTGMSPNICCHLQVICILVVMFVIISDAVSGSATAGWTWEIAVIVLAALILIAAVVVVVFCIIKRKRSSPAQKKKAAASEFPC